MKYIWSIMLVGLLSSGFSQKQDSPSSSAIAFGHNPQPLLNSIHSVIAQAVGANVSDQIPGYTYGHDELVLDTGGIECPKEISDVKQASDLLCSKLSSAFTNRLANISAEPFARRGDVVITAKMSNDWQAVTISISVFKRSSSRVVLFPVMLSESAKQ